MLIILGWSRFLGGPYHGREDSKTINVKKKFKFHLFFLHLNFVLLSKKTPKPKRPVTKTLKKFKKKNNTCHKQCR